MREPVKIEEDVLFLACTRPSMVGGVTVEAMAINVIGTGLFFLATGSGVVCLLFGIIFHVLLKMILAHDHNHFRVLKAWLDTSGRGRVGANAVIVQGSEK